MGVQGIHVSMRMDVNREYMSFWTKEKGEEAVMGFQRKQAVDRSLTTSRTNYTGR